MNVPWQGNNGGFGIADHPAYWPAKKKRDVRAAIALCDELVTEENLEYLYDLGYGTDPIVAVPAVTIHETQNALARTYGQWLATKMNWSLDSKIYQTKTINRDFNTDGWFRIVNEPAYYGKVEPGRPYIIADDVCAMGGTLASLRGYIETNGGKVLGMTVLASGSGKNVQISLVGDTFARLTTAWNGELIGAYPQEIGHELESVTEPEGQFLLRCPSYDGFRAGIDGARNGGD
ncbi:phosphoribosyltransferase [Bradyrhizobium sp. LVM 105]|uniref:phosphoribosyltransferase n=1 Tax=Bradyrhizobium sp. LVM 105 TaxID=2341115 RepID=UPI000F80E9E3|nr:phosphoribosyltransferase [Bradyrhizobium sp. LVM 105]